MDRCPFLEQFLLGILLSFDALFDAVSIQGSCRELTTLFGQESSEGKGDDKVFEVKVTDPEEELG